MSMRWYELFNKIIDDLEEFECFKTKEYLTSIQKRYTYEKSCNQYELLFLYINSGLRKSEIVAFEYSLQNRIERYQKEGINTLSEIESDIQILSQINTPGYSNGYSSLIDLLLSSIDETENKLLKSSKPLTSFDSDIQSVMDGFLNFTQCLREILHSKTDLSDRYSLTSVRLSNF